MPALVGREAFGGEADLGRHAELELVVGDLEEGQQFTDKDPHVLLIDECVRELEGTPTNRNVTVAETVEDDVAVPLHGVSVYCDNLVERIERHISTAQKPGVSDW